MRGLILAAGGGSRLGRGPKCLLEVGGRTLIDHQLDALESIGISSVTLVVGCQEAAVRSAVGSQAGYVINRSYTVTNSLYSFWLAREAIDDDDVIVMNSDVLCDACVVEQLADAPGSAFAYDSTSGTDPEEMAVELADGRLVQMSKQLPAWRTWGENLGVLRLDRAVARESFDAAGRLIQAGSARDYMAAAINLAAREHRLTGLDAAGTAWVEIDFPADLERARREVLPRILAGRRRGERIAA